MKRTLNKPGPLHHSTPCEDRDSLEVYRLERGVKHPFENDLRPSKFCRQDSRLFSVLSTLGSSVSNSSFAESTLVSPPSSPLENQLFSPVLVKGQPNSTIVHCIQYRNRPSIFSIENGVDDLTEKFSPLTTIGSSSNNGKSPYVLPGAVESVEKVPLGLKLSVKKNMSFYPIPRDQFLMARSMGGEDSTLENLLAPIAEDINFEVKAPEIVPTFVTVEKVALAKIFLERHYNKLISCPLTPRSLRRRQVEGFLHRNQQLSAYEREEIRNSLARDESEHLRHARVMKSRRRNTKKEKDMTTSMYEVIKVLGKGSFGVVRLVREKMNDSSTFRSNQEFNKERRAVYAMKVIKKSNMLQNSQEGHLHAERDFFVAAEGSRWIVPLITSFQDASNLYLVMDYMPGGDFLGLLIRENILSEPVTKWYIAEMILCIEEAHNLHWIHRDIKPDNFLISASGHLKISDFGLAFDGHWSHDQSYFNNHRYSLLTKLGLNIEGDSLDKKEGKTVAAAMKLSQVLVGGKERHETDTTATAACGGVLNWRNKNSNRSFARSVVGTSQYMAPEVVRGKVYDARCDWWSLGVILYECLYGHTPFLAEEGGRQQTKLNIIVSIHMPTKISLFLTFMQNHKSVFKFPQRPVVSRKCQDLIRGIIQEKENRLCSKRYRTKEQPTMHHLTKDHTGRYVYPNDAEDIKSHKWFRDIPWDRLHLMIPPAIPKLQSMEDTRYFDEEESISDFSESFSEVPHTQNDIENALRPFNREIQILTQGYLETPTDSTKLKKIEKEIDQLIISEEQKQYLKAVVKLYGRKERKRPRDILLRDKLVGPKVLDLRKEGAFLGYTYRRFESKQMIVGGSLRPDHCCAFRRTRLSCVPSF